MKNKTLFGYLILCGVFLLFDRVLKYAATTGSLARPFLLHRYFGWEPYLNKGVAFGIPIPMPLVFLLTTFIIGSVSYFFYIIDRSSSGKNVAGRWGLALVLAGAISNLVDRISFGHTIDYVRIFTSVINMADVFIVAGFILYFSSLKRSS